MSLLFYYMGDGEYVIILIISILWNYYFGILISTSTEKRAILSLNILGNIFLLIYYKYSSFFLDIIGQSKSSTNSNLALPLGISFFTFQGISYVVDVYRNPINYQVRLTKIGLYIALFPQLIAGPIIKYHELESYLQQRTVNLHKLSSGLLRFIKGLAKKVLIADQLVQLVDPIFASPIQELHTFDAWIALIAFSLQIYFDFSAYSDMAIGIGRMLGFKIPENFNYPYVASSFKDFWKRWHISLSTWFRDYLYIPLGGNRKGKWRTIFNLIFVFFITGLWHGANYTFIAWGMFHGFFLLLEKLQFRIKTPQIIRRSITFFLVTLSWVWFRNQSFGDSLIYFEHLFLGHFSQAPLSPLYLNSYLIFTLIVGLLFSFQLKPIILNGLNSLTFINENRLTWLKYSSAIILLILCMMELSSLNHQPFIYFKF